MVLLKEEKGIGFLRNDFCFKFISNIFLFLRGKSNEKLLILYRTI